MRKEFADALLPGFERYRKEREDQNHTQRYPKLLSQFQNNRGEEFDLLDVIEDGGNPTGHEIVCRLVAEDVLAGLSPVEQALLHLDAALGSAMIDKRRVFLYRLLRLPATTVRQRCRRSWSRASAAAKRHPLLMAEAAIEEEMRKLGGGPAGESVKPRPRAWECRGCKKRVRGAYLCGRCRAKECGSSWRPFPALKWLDSEGSMSRKDHDDAEELTRALRDCATWWGDALPSRSSSRRVSRDLPALDAWWMFASLPTPIETLRRYAVDGLPFMHALLPPHPHRKDAMENGRPSNVVTWKGWECFAFPCYPNGNGQREQWYGAQNGGAPIYAPTPKILLGMMKERDRKKMRI